MTQVELSCPFSYGVKVNGTFALSCHLHVVARLYAHKGISIYFVAREQMPVSWPPISCG